MKTIFFWKNKIDTAGARIQEITIAQQTKNRMRVTTQPLQQITATAHMVNTNDCEMMMLLTCRRSVRGWRCRWLCTICCQTHWWRVSDRVVYTHQRHYHTLNNIVSSYPRYKANGLPSRAFIANTYTPTHVNHALTPYTTHVQLDRSRLKTACRRLSLYTTLRRDARHIRAPICLETICSHKQ